MVVAFQPNLMRFLHALHRCDHTAGIEEWLRSQPSLATVRSVYRWQDDLGDDLRYYPAVAYTALGLTHLHLIIDEPRRAWTMLPYAIRASWLTRHPGVRVLYLHCLVPAHDVPALRALLSDLSSPDADRVTLIATGDGWQALDTGAPVTPLPPACVGAWDAVERYPLLVPVICESIEARRSLAELWSAIADRLGPRVWQFLPRGTRRLPHNGKAYVREALHLLNETFLFRQHVVRYAAYDTNTMEIVLRVRAGVEEILRIVSSDAPVLDVFPGEDECLVRLHGTLMCLSRLFSAFTTFDVAAWWFVDRTANQQSPLHVRFAYEHLFDPATTEWLFPREEIIARLSR